jgi:hypothetical protein
MIISNLWFVSEPFERLTDNRPSCDDFLPKTRSLPKTEQYFGPNGREPFSAKLRRPFVLPAFSVPGPATYHSEACFVCNPLQKFANWPVCKTTPDVSYEVAN